MYSYSEIKNHIIDKLQKGLPADLTYHNLAHTLDVLEQAIIIAKKERITDPQEILLLKISVLYHDAGFIEAYSGHEERGCALAKQELVTFGFTPEQIEQVCNMIRATKLPQSPQTHLEEIICDADLDYLGRPDFFRIANGLYRELRHQQLIKDDREWNLLQINFLENHRYFTRSSILRRQKSKLQHLATIKERIGTFN